MNKFEEIFGIVVLVLFCIYLIISWIIFIYHYFKCFNIHRCNNSSCKFCTLCPKYHKIYTDEEIEELYKMVDELFGNKENMT